MKGPFWSSFDTNVPLNVIQHAWSQILHDKLDGKTFSQCQTWKSQRQACRRRTRRQKSNNSYGKYLAVEWRQHFTYAAVYVDCVENKEWKKERGEGEGEREERESGFVVRRCVKKGWQQRYAGHHSCKLQQFSYACGCGFLSSSKKDGGNFYCTTDEVLICLSQDPPEIDKLETKTKRWLKTHNNYTSAVLVSG